MVSFRKWILALTVLVMFSGLASAQLINNNVSCTTNISTTPILRAEGYTEQTGDISFQCNGGVPLATASAIPQINVTIFLNTTVTSRLLPISNVTSSASEALLMIDEPGSNLPGSTPIQKVCPTPLTGCLEYVGATGGPVDACTTFNPNGTCAVPSAVLGANLFQGVVTSNQVTFYGIPVLPPGTAGSRVFRITNVRANATTLGGGSAAGAAPVIASISINGATAFQISNSTPVVGYVQPGLSASASSATNLNQCNTTTRGAVSILTYTEGFGNAFKTRIAAQSNTAYAGQGGSPVQNVPGTVYFSESNFVAPVNSGTAGLADFGTRLKASFTNIPAGIRLFVSTNNVTNAALNAVAPAVVGGSAGNTASGNVWAQLVTSETASDGNINGFFPSVTSTDTVGNVPLVEIPVVNGAASAVWEVINTNPNALESIKFAAYTTFVANVASNSPPAGTAQVNLSFAPTPPAFTAASAAAASSSLPIPRFAQDASAARNIFTINICRTVLLYPFVTTSPGFDTGIAIANTTTDPFGTGAQAGSCKLNWYQGATNPAQGDTGSIASGTVYANQVSTLVGSGFNGYMIAVCNFQYAHGYAAVSDLGARNFVTSYLALVIPDPTTQANGVRNASANGCNSTGSDIRCGGGEEGGH